ncbi:MAG TPA: amidohydrolase family protein [Candidatus Binataceae bacterium]|nr:amidohydrolase family protein [Candidatus Binataceae bacterium]
MTIDTHVHIVAPDQIKYPRKLARANIEWVADMSAETMLELMTAAGIDRAMLVQAHSAYEYDNSYVADAAALRPDRFVSVCILDPARPDAPDQLSYWVEQRGVRGLRLFPAAERDPAWLDDPASFPLWERAGALNIPVCVCLRWRQLARLRTAIERHPRVHVALDHLGLPPLEEGPPYGAAAPLFELVKLPNVYLKFSSVNLYAAARGASTPREFFRRLLEAFGARRMMWGSNFPNTNDRSLKDQLALAREALAFASEEDRRWLFSETALSLWPMLR